MFPVLQPIRTKKKAYILCYTETEGSLFESTSVKDVAFKATNQVQTKLGICWIRCRAVKPGKALPDRWINRREQTGIVKVRL